MYLGYVFKELSRRKTRTATNVLIIGAITALLLLSTSLMDAYVSAVYLPFKGVDSDMILYVQGNSTAPTQEIRQPFGRGVFSADETKQIEKLEHVTAVSQSLVLWDYKNGSFVTIEGIDPDSYSGAKMNAWVTEGRFITSADSGKAVIESHYAKFNHLKTGSNVTVNNQTFNLVGIYKTRDESQIFASNILLKLSDARIIGNTSGCNQVYLKIDDLSNQERVTSGIKKLDDKILVMGADTISGSLGNLLSIYKQFYLIGLGTVILTAFLLLLKTNTTNILERKRDIGVMQSVGWTEKEIKDQIILETLAQTLAGFAAGLTLSIAAVLIISSVSVQVQSEGLSAGPQIITIPLLITPDPTLGYFGLIMVTSFVASYYPAKRAATTKPAKNMGE